MMSFLTLFGGCDGGDGGGDVDDRVSGTSAFKKSPRSSKESLSSDCFALLRHSLHATPATAKAIKAIEICLSIKAVLRFQDSLLVVVGVAFGIQCPGPAPLRLRGVPSP